VLVPLGAAWFTAALPWVEAGMMRPGVADIWPLWRRYSPASAGVRETLKSRPPSLVWRTPARTARSRRGAVP
jgi:hypothetical protein